VNLMGRALNAANAARTYDEDNGKNVALRLSQDAGPLRLGA